MANIQAHAEDFGDGIARSDWGETLARLGYAAKGFVYVVVGALAVAAAFNAGGDITGSRGALSSVVEQPFGRILLGIVSLGLFGYVLWRFAQSFGDAEDKGTSKKGLVWRGRAAVSGFIYAGLAVHAGALALGGWGGSSSDGGGNQAATWTAKLMEQPFGQWLVVIVGAIIVGAAFVEWYSAYSLKFMKHLKTNEMNQKVEKGVRVTGRLGHAARGVVFFIIGIFLVWAGVSYDPDRALGLEGALRTLTSQPYGPWLLAATAVGLVAYGVSEFVKARYRRIPAD